MVRIINDGDIFGTGHFVASRPPDPTLKTPKKKKGFWADQVSTGGGIGGALAGGAAGAALGSAVPGIGTAIGGLLGAILGGGAGSAGGEVAENAIQGEDLSKNVLKEGLIGGVTSLPIGAGLKLARAGGKSLMGAGGREAASNLVQEAGVQTIGRGTLGKLTANGVADNAALDAANRVATAPGLVSKLGSRLNGTADDLAIKQFRFTPSQLKNFKAKFGEDAGQTIRKYGFTNVDDIAEKGIDPLQGQFDELVTGVGQVPTDLLKKNFDGAINKLAKSPVSDNRALSKILKSEADGIIKGAGPVIDANELNVMRREFDKLVSYTNSVANPARYGVNKRVADTLRKTLQGADSTGTLKATGKELQKLRQLADNAAQQEQLGRGSLPFGLGSAPGAILGSTGGPIGAAAGMAGQAVANSPTGRRVAMNAVDKIAGKLSEASIRPVGQSLISTAGRFGTVGALESALNNPQSENMYNNPNTTTASTNMPMTSNMDSQYTQTPEMSNPLGVSSTEVGQALMMAYASGDTDAVKQLQGMYDLVTEFEKNAGGGELGASAATQVASNSNAVNTLSQLESLFSNAGGGGGKLGGGLANALAGAGLNGETQIYNDLAASSVSQLARALNGGGQVSDADAAVVIQALPKITDSPQVAQAKFNALKARLENARQNTLLYSGGATQSPETTAVY